MAGVEISSPREGRECLHSKIVKADFFSPLRYLDRKCRGWRDAWTRHFNKASCSPSNLDNVTPLVFALPLPLPENMFHPWRNAKGALKCSNQLTKHVAMWFLFEASQITSDEYFFMERLRPQRDGWTNIDSLIRMEFLSLSPFSNRRYGINLY